MEKRLNIQELEPQAYKAMFGLETYLAKTQLSKTHRDLVKIRASQVNRCAFCIDMHTTEALKNGETNQRIFLLDAWRETSLFTDEERVILEITEEITFIHKNGLSPETYQKALLLLGESYLAQIIMAVVSINAWNRIAISTTMGAGITSNLNSAS